MLASLHLYYIQTEEWTNHSETFIVSDPFAISADPMNGLQ